MLRSFAYASYAALFAYSAARPEILERLEPCARLWQRYASIAFLRTYLSLAGGPPVLPSTLPAIEALLGAFLIDKALGEIETEVAARPDWLRIPLQGLLSLLPAA
jgi:maltose alpha-D-glucosyltransferase/alpha-amylase